MSGTTCDSIRAASLDPEDASRSRLSRPDVAAHLRGCAECRDWVEAFRAGEHTWADESGAAFTNAVLARTTGLEAIIRDLPSLADIDPGPGFAERVLLATSGRAASRGWRDRLTAAWWALVRRPRFAWEAAYVATVCWVLVFGNPVGALQWSTSTVATAARERLVEPVGQLRTDLESWRAKWAPEPEPVPGAAPRGEAEHPILQAWQAGVKQVQRGTSYVLDAMARAWARVSGWISGLIDEIWPPPAEPQPGPVRSAR